MGKGKHFWLSTSKDQECNGEKKNHLITRKFCEFDLKRKIKKKVDWGQIYCVQDFLHRIDGILSVVTGYFSRKNIIT